MPVTSTKSAYAHSSDSPIKGNPSFIYELENFDKAFDKNLMRVMTEVITEGRRQLRNAARHDPYWAEYEEMLDIRFHDGAFQYTLTGPQERIKAALDVEYGTEADVPHSLLRRMALRQQSELIHLLTQKLTAVVPNGR